MTGSIWLDFGKLWGNEFNEITSFLFKSDTTCKVRLITSNSQPHVTPKAYLPKLDFPAAFHPLKVITNGILKVFIIFSLSDLIFLLSSFA